MIDLDNCLGVSRRSLLLGASALVVALVAPNVAGPNAQARGERFAEGDFFSDGFGWID